MSPRDADTQPLLSVVLLAGDVQRLPATIHSVVGQESPLNDVEVVLVTSAGDTRPLEERGARVRRITSQTTAAAALTAGLEAATGAFVTVLEAGDVASPNLLHEFRKAARRGQIAVASAGHALPVGIHVDGAAEVVSTLSGKLIPAEWCDNVLLPPLLAQGLAPAFYGQVLAPYARRFSTLDAQPADNGALVDCGPRHERRTFRDSVEEPLAVVAALCSGYEAHLADRPPLTRELVSQQMAIVAAYSQKNPEAEAQVRAAIRATGVTGVGLAGPGGWPWPTFASLMGDASPRERRVVLVGGSASSLSSQFKEIGLLRKAGVVVELVYRTGRLDERVSGVPNHRLKVLSDRRAAPPPRGAAAKTTRIRRRALKYWSTVGSVGTRVALRMLPPPWVAAQAKLHDRKGVDLISGGDIVLAMDAEGEAFALAAGARLAPITSLSSLVLAAAADVLSLASQDARALSAAAAHLQKLEPGDPSLPPPEVWGMAYWRLYRARRMDRARGVAAIAMQLHPHSGTEQGLVTFDALASIVAGEGLGEAGLDAATSVAVAADAALASGELARAAFLLDLVVETLFHGDIQANVAEPPLLMHLDALMAPLAGSVAWKTLCASQAEDRIPAPAPPVTDGRPRVLVLPGTYPKFSGSIVEALEADSTVTVLPLASMHQRYSVSSSTPSDIYNRLNWSMGLTPSLEAGVASAFGNCDAIFADWADKGAVMASMLAPRACRVVVRFHGVDTLSPWQFLIDWDRVTDVIFVSDHLRRAVLQTLGARIAHVRQHVAPNVVDVDRFSQSSPDSAARTLGMVGWGQKVKDPLWTLELLAALRHHDPAWRLKLIGHDFPARSPRASERAYAEAFRARAARPDLVDAIDYVGFSSDLPRHLTEVGFAISSSFRESFHIGAVEMVASGAVPVFRDWPVYAQVGGVVGLFPDDWMVRSVDEATARILALADPTAWRAAAAAATDEVRRRFSQGATQELYRRIILGGDEG